jgi:hypothetical protein
MVPSEPSKSMTLVKFQTPLGVLYLTRGGVQNTALPPKNHFPQFLPIVVCFTTSSFRSIFERTKTNFKNLREVFSHHGLRNKNLFHFLQRSHKKRSSKTSSRPIFPYFSFSVSVLIFQELSRPAGDEFGETEGGFCP